MSGYEIHAGVTRGDGLAGAVADLPHGPDGARSADECVLGTYLHGVFDESAARDALLQWAGLTVTAAAPDYERMREEGFDRLADACAEAIDRTALAALLGPAGDGLRTEITP